MVGRAAQNARNTPEKFGQMINLAWIEGKVTIAGDRSAKAKKETEAGEVIRVENEQRKGCSVRIGSWERTTKTSMQGEQPL